MLNGDDQYNEQIFHEFNLSVGIVRSMSNVVWVDIISNLEFLEGEKGSRDDSFDVLNEYILELLTQQEIDFYETAPASKVVQNQELVILWYTIVLSFLNNSNGKID